jgi:hypothetical protein
VPRTATVAVCGHARVLTVDGEALRAALPAYGVTAAGLLAS